jgi:hypothetical protein
VSTAFYIAEKGFIESTYRLKNLYEVADKDPFPLKNDAYPLVTRDQLAGGEVVYGQSAYCSFYDTIHENDYKAVRRLTKFWDQSLSRRIGSNKSVDAKRIIILFTNRDYECVYPAQEFKTRNAFTRNKKQQILNTVLSTSNKLYIERNVKYLFDDESETGFTNYWMPIQDTNNRNIGVIGMQFDMNDYFELIPSAVLEKNYPISMIGLYDNEMKQIWNFGCTDPSCS